MCWFFNVQYKEVVGIDELQDINDLFNKSH